MISFQPSDIHARRMSPKNSHKLPESIQKELDKRQIGKRLEFFHFNNISIIQLISINKTIKYLGQLFIVKIFLNNIETY